MRQRAVNGGVREPGIELYFAHRSARLLANPHAEWSELVPRHIGINYSRQQRKAS